MARFRFGSFVFDSDRYVLLQNDRPVELTRKGFLLLEMLVTNRPSPVAKEQILGRIWADCFVAEGSVTRLVSDVRVVLGDAEYIKTVHGIGYAFQGDVQEVDAAPDGDVRFVLIDKGPPPRSMAMQTGTVTVGRGLECDLRIPSTTVSRTHARIRVTQDAATLEDLGSRNGTFVRDQRVTAPVALVDGDEIRLGKAELVFRVQAPAQGKTETVT